MGGWTVEGLETATVVGIATFVLGVAFGAISQASGFCTMGALSDVVFLADWRRLRAWMLAAAVALSGTQGLHAAGLIDLGRSAYLSGPLSWGGAVIGGLAFGVGMTLAGGCGAKILVRLGGGNMKSLVVALVVGLFAMMTMKGLLAPLRLALETVTPLSLPVVAEPGLPALLEWAGWPAARISAVALIGGGLAWWCLKDGAFRRSPSHWLSGVGVGLLIPAGWAVSGILGDDPFDPSPLTSFSFAAPIGGSLAYLMTYTGATLSFGVAAVAGTVTGAFAVAAFRHSVRLEGFHAADDLLRHLAGGALMGSGGVLALGCTIGQGLTGLSTLSLTAPLALAAIIAGGLAGLKYLEEGSVAGVLAPLVRQHQATPGPADKAAPPRSNVGCSD